MLVSFAVLSFLSEKVSPPWPIWQDDCFKNKICYQHSISHLQWVQEKSQYSKGLKKSLYCHHLCENPSFQGGLCEAKLVPKIGREAAYHSRPCCLLHLAIAISWQVAFQIISLGWCKACFFCPTPLLERTCLRRCWTFGQGLPFTWPQVGMTSPFHHRTH